MQYRRFGKTELEIPVFSCGGMRYQFSWEDKETPNITESNQENLKKTIYRSFDLGINHIETARDYGTSEIQLGKFLNDLPRKELILQTKVPPYEDPKEFEKVLEHSFDNMQQDYIDLFSFHGINLPEHLDWVMNGCYEVALRWKQQGRIRHIGFSTHGQTDLIVKSIQTGLFDYVNLHWYYFMQRNEPAIIAANLRDMGVFIISPSDKGGKLYEPPQKLVDLCQPYSPMVFNNLFCLNNPMVHTLSIGAARPSDFDEHLKTLELIGKEETFEIEDKIQNAMLNHHGLDWANNWDKGLPTVDNTPGKINLYEIIRFWNLATSLDMTAFGKMRYALLGEKNHWFPGLNAETIDKEAMKDALRNSDFADRIIDVLKESHQMFKE
ncbi:MAG: aldo/keto reductase [Lentisphaeraceae bacterium]|nr:aldo/keto reductase [Lentisphaeraceae bacterium]